MRFAVRLRVGIRDADDGRANIKRVDRVVDEMSAKRAGIAGRLSVPARAPVITGCQWVAGGREKKCIDRKKINTQFSDAGLAIPYN